MYSVRINNSWRRTPSVSHFPSVSNSIYSWSSARQRRPWQPRRRRRWRRHFIVNNRLRMADREWNRQTFEKIFQRGRNKITTPTTITIIITRIGNKRVGRCLGHRRHGNMCYMRVQQTTTTKQRIAYIYLYIHTHMYVYICIKCMCVCVYVYQMAQGWRKL